MGRAINNRICEKYTLYHVYKNKELIEQYVERSKSGKIPYTYNI